MSVCNLWLQDVKTDPSVAYILPSQWYPGSSSKRVGIGKYSTKLLCLEKN
jgi:hypothetical protein